jgi:hypothetical protein
MGGMPSQMSTFATSSWSQNRRVVCRFRRLRPRDTTGLLLVLLYLHAGWVFDYATMTVRGVLEETTANSLRFAEEMARLTCAVWSNHQAQRKC